MSIHREACLVVGLRVCDIKNSALVDDEVFDICSPYYDCGEAEEQIAGFIYIRTGGPCAVLALISEPEIEHLKQKFRELTGGQEPQLWLSPWVC